MHRIRHEYACRRIASFQTLKPIPVPGSASTPTSREVTLRPFAQLVCHNNVNHTSPPSAHWCTSYPCPLSTTTRCATEVRCA